MKKIIYIIVLLITLFLVSGCSSGNDVSYDTNDYQKINATYKYINLNCSHEVVEKADLPTTSENGATITWTSSNKAIISDSGEVVTRPSENTKVAMNCHIELNGLSKDFTFTLNVSAMTFDEALSELDKYIPEKLDDDVDIPAALNSGLIKVIAQSKDNDVLTDNGAYCGCYTEREIELDVTLTDGYKRVNKKYTLQVEGAEMDVRFAQTIEWIRSEGLKDTYLTKDTVLPTFCPKTGANISWLSTVEGVLDENNHIIEYVYERYTALIAKMNIGDEWEREYIACKIQALDTSKMSEEEILENFISTITVSSYSRLTFDQSKGILNAELAEENYGYTKDQTSSYGFLSFFTPEKLVPIDKIAPLNDDNRPGLKLTQVAYITVHDTASTGGTADAKSHANYVYTGGNGTSWHYTVDDISVYHQIPNDEVAWHAGDSGHRPFAMIDTGIKATAIRPYIKLVNGYYNINGVQTLFCPIVKDFDTEEETYTPVLDAAINQQSIFCEIGENGNYWIGKTYYNATYKRIANYGGNTSSIGIESCVNGGHDYATTARNLAELVASLCIQYDLSVDRVHGHHYFSGKPCPNAILLAEWWSNFLDLVSLEKFGQEHYSNYTFTWTSNNDLMSNTGKILNTCKVGNVLDYSLSVKNAANQEVYSKSFKTTLK